MEIVDQSAVLLEHNIPPYEFIEQVARTCYKSEDKITPGSAEKMVNALLKSSHLAMFEHEHIAIRCSFDTFTTINDHPKQRKFINALLSDKYDTVVLYGSYRAWIEFCVNMSLLINTEYLSDRTMMMIVNALHDFDKNVFPISYDDVSYDDDIEILTKRDMESIIDEAQCPEPLDVVSHTIKFTTSRAIANELVRHRNNIAFAQESQRYVDYKKNDRITIIQPMIAPDSAAYNDWHYAMLMAETQYFNLRKQGVLPQIARGVLPNDCKTEIVVTATEDEWQHIVNLRYYGTTGAPHPQMKELIGMALPLLNKDSKGRIK